MDKETALQAWKRMRNEIDADNWLFVGTINPEMVDRAIEALEGKDTNVSPKWIPVSERLPEEEGDYLVTDDSGGEKWVDSSVFLRCDDGSVYWDFANVTAWMPLPEPWKGEQHETD